MVLFFFVWSKHEGFVLHTIDMFKNKPDTIFSKNGLNKQHQTDPDKLFTRIHTGSFQIIIPLRPSKLLWDHSHLKLPWSDRMVFCYVPWWVWSLWQQICQKVVGWKDFCSTSWGAEYCIPTLFSWTLYIPIDCPILYGLKPAPIHRS